MENSHRLSNPILGGKIWTLNGNGGDDDDEEEDGRCHLILLVDFHVKMVD